MVRHGATRCDTPDVARHLVRHPGATPIGVGACRTPPTPPPRRRTATWPMSHKPPVASDAAVSLPARVRLRGLEALRRPRFVGHPIPPARRLEAGSALAPRAVTLRSIGGERSGGAGNRFPRGDGAEPLAGPLCAPCARPGAPRTLTCGDAIAPYLRIRALTCAFASGSTPGSSLRATRPPVLALRPPHRQHTPSARRRPSSDPRPAAPVRSLSAARHRGGHRGVGRPLAGSQTRGEASSREEAP